MDLFSERRILTISQLTTLLRGVVEENFEQVWVQGEVSNLALPQSGHAYFTLKDSGAQLRCVMFKAAARSLRFRFQDGIALIARGRLTVYDQRGEYQLVIEYLEPVGLGALQLAFQQLKDKLSNEGLFAAERKKTLPYLPQRIGIVTSPTGAAIHDILQVLDRRFANLEILLCPVKVQGVGAAEEIAAAIRDLNRYGSLDVLIVGRGGGSLEDLWAFNEEVVARAIVASRIPIISAVGHEVDVTISDLVADLRAPTPSAAAELVVRSKSELTNELLSLRQRLSQSMQHSVGRSRRLLDTQLRLLKDPLFMMGRHAQRVDELTIRMGQNIKRIHDHSGERCRSLAGRLALQQPKLRLERAWEHLLLLSQRLLQTNEQSLERRRDALAAEVYRLNALSPLAVLERGYALVQGETNRQLVRDSRQLAPGDRIRVTLHRGAANCTVENTLPETGRLS